MHSGWFLPALAAVGIVMTTAVGAVAAQTQDSPGSTPPADDAPATGAAASGPATEPGPATVPEPATAPGVTAPPAPVIAPETATGRGRVRGVVTDSVKKPVGGRLVVLVSHAEGEALRVTSTDEKGRYQFRDLPPGIYEIRLEADGFDPETKKGIDVRPPFQNVVDVTLRRAASGTPPRAHAGTAAAAEPAATGPAAPAPAPAAGEIVRGILHDGGGTPVVEAEVILVPLAAGSLHQGTSGKDGSFRIPDVAPGGYRLIVRSLGHVPIDVSRVDVNPADGLALRLTLVDYALNFVSGATRPILERPRPRPAGGAAPGGATPPSTRALAPEPEPEPLIPPPPEEKSTTQPPADEGGASPRS